MLETNQRPTETPEDRRVQQWVKPPSSVYDISNPFGSARIFHDCLTVSGGTVIRVEGAALNKETGKMVPGEVKGVELADHVAKQAEKDGLTVIKHAPGQNESDPPVKSIQQQPQRRN